MRVTFIGHASLLVEAKGLSILSDPWWRGPCFGAQWWVCPPPDLSPLEAHRVLDYIYISHGHEDHLHLGTLRQLDRSAKILVARSIGLAEAIRAAGFDVIEVGDGETLALGRGVSCRIVPTYGGDTYLVLSDGEETLINFNDAVHPLPAHIRNRFIARERKLNGRIDYMFCGHGVASHFPNCYLVPGKDPVATSRKRQDYFNRAWADIARRLEPRFAFPFAADVALLEEDLIWANETVHNAERPPEVLRRLYPECPVRAIDIAPGFLIRDGEVGVSRTRTPLSTDKLRGEYADQIARANRYGRVSPEDVDLVVGLLSDNLQRFAPYLASFSGDYAILGLFRNCPSGIEITKRGAEIAVSPVNLSEVDRGGYDLVFTTRLPYLRRSLTVRHANEILFVGSGILFEYPDRARMKRDLHEELMVMVSPFASAPSRSTKNLKRLVKRLLRNEQLDLYNIERWTVFGDEARPAGPARLRAHRAVPDR